MTANRPWGVPGQHAAAIELPLEAGVALEEEDVVPGSYGKKGGGGASGALSEGGSGTSSPPPSPSVPWEKNPRG